MEIKTEVRYVARLTNGIILEDSDFRNVYRGAVRELRAQYGHSLYFDCGKADISLCVVTEVYYDGSRYTSARAELRKICTIDICSMDRVTHVMPRRED